MSGVLDIWVIFDHPLDFPDSYVVAVQRVGASGVEHLPQRWLRATLEGARDVVQRHHPFAVCLERQPQDDPAVVESWI